MNNYLLITLLTVEIAWSRVIFFACLRRQANFIFIQMKNPAFAGHFIFFAGVYKPNFVPILFTEGGAKLSILSLSKDMSLENTRDAQFCIRLWRTKLATVIYLGLKLL